MNVAEAVSTGKGQRKALSLFCHAMHTSCDVYDAPWRGAIFAHLYGESGNENASLGRLLLSALVIFTTACGSISGLKACHFEQRSVFASGEFVLPDTTTVTAHVDLVESRKSTDRHSRKDLQIGAQSYTLYPHMTRAELRDNHTPSTLLGSFLPGVGLLTAAPNLVGTFSPYDWTLTIDQARALIQSGDLVMEITTDLPTQSLIRIPLTTTSHADGTWFREHGESCP